MTSVAYISRYKNYSESCYGGGVNYKSYQKYDYNRNVRETFPVRSSHHEREQNAFNTSRNSGTYYQPQPQPQPQSQTDKVRPCSWTILLGQS